MKNFFIVLLLFSFFAMEPLLFAAGSDLGMSGQPPEKRQRKTKCPPFEKRLRKELLTLSAVQDAHLLGAFPCKKKTLWRAYIHGPDDSLYTGLRFDLGFEFTERYPLEPPKVFFITPCYHPNVYLQSGEICVDFLKEAWSPSMNIESILRSLTSLLNEPNPASALNGEAARYFLENGQLKNGELISYASKILRLHEQGSNPELDKKFAGF
jgi:ubiquitin-protein ligase